METIVSVISLIFFALLILSPILILNNVNKSNIKFKCISYLIIGFVVSSIILLIFAWWNYESTKILLRHYDGYIYNPDSDVYQVEYEKVLPKNFEKVQELERSLMGIGWPLKAFMSYVYYFPYLLIVYCVNYLMSEIKRRRILKIELKNTEEKN